MAACLWVVFAPSGQNQRKFSWIFQKEFNQSHPVLFLMRLLHVLAKGRLKKATGSGQFFIAHTLVPDFCETSATLWNWDWVLGKSTLNPVRDGSRLDHGVCYQEKLYLKIIWWHNAWAHNDMKLLGKLKEKSARVMLCSFYLLRKWKWKFSFLEQRVPRDLFNERMLSLYHMSYEKLFFFLHWFIVGKRRKQWYTSNMFLGSWIMKIKKDFAGPER